MPANAQMLAGAMEERAAEMQRNAEALQQLFYAQGQNAATAANLTPDATMAFRGREETAESAAIRLQSELESQQKINRLKSTLDFDELSIDLADESRQLIAERRAVAEDIAAKKSVSLFDNPFEALANAFALPWDEQRLEGIDQRIAGNKAAANDINAQIQTYSETTNKTAEALNAAAVQSLTAGIAANQNIRLLEANNKALALDAQGIQQTAQMNTAALQLRGQAYNILATEEQRQFMREQRIAALEQRELDRHSKDKVKKLIAEDIAFVKDTMLRDGMTDANGNPNMTDDQILNLLDRKHPTVLEMRDRGLFSAMQGRAAYGETPEQTLNYIRNTGVVPKTEAQEALYNLNTAALEAVKDEKDKTVRAEKSKQVLKTVFERWEADVGSGDKSNPLSLPAYSHFAGKKSIVTNPAYEYVKDLVEGESTKAVPLDGQVVYDRMVQALKDGKITPAAAESLLYSIGEVSRADIASVNKVYEYTGLTQTKAVVQVKPGSAVGSLLMGASPAPVAATGYMMNRTRVPMDILNRSSIRNALAQGVAAKLMLVPNTSGSRAEGSPNFYPPLTMYGLYKENNGVK